MSAKQTRKTVTAKPKAKTKPAKPATKATAKSKTAAKKPSPKKTAAKTAGGKALVAKFPTGSGRGGMDAAVTRQRGSFAKGKTPTRKIVRDADFSRRPPNNSEMPMDYIEDMETSFTSWRDELEDFSAHLRALDRKRLNGVGIKKLGFIGRALLLAAENPEFLPHYLTLRKFQNDNNYFLALRSVFDVLRQIQEILWNIIIEASDVLYTDALEYYAGVREAAKRRVDPAETLYKDLSIFFKSRGRRLEEEPTDKQLKRDFNALVKGRKNGKIVIENEMPKTQGGKRKVIDQTYKDVARFRESEEGDFQE